MTAASCAQACKSAGEVLDAIKEWQEQGYTVVNLPYDNTLYQGDVQMQTFDGGTLAKEPA